MFYMVGHGVVITVSELLSETGEQAHPFASVEVTGNACPETSRPPQQFTDDGLRR